MKASLLVVDDVPDEAEPLAEVVGGVVLGAEIVRPAGGEDRTGRSDTDPPLHAPIGPLPPLNSCNKT